MNFDWQTDEDSDWQDEGPALADASLPVRRRWLWIVLVLLLVPAIAMVTWRQVYDRIEEATSTVRGDVLSSRILARQAAAERDEELLVSVLSGRNTSWTEAQQERLGKGLLFEDALRPLEILPQDGPTEDVTVTLNPELSEAVVTTIQPFSVDVGGGLSATIRLTQTSVYRRGDRRWLLSPPVADFWGPRQTIDADPLTVIVPERDQDLAQKLAPEIAASLDDLCRQIVPCPQGFHIRLRLERDPSSVNQSAEPARRLGPDQTLTLPTPTLLGLPVDGQAHEALSRAYARQVVAAAITSLVEYECCRGIFFYQALLEMQLAQLDLRPPPLAADAYRHLLDMPTSAEHMEEFWEKEQFPGQDPSIPPEIYNLVAFLQQRSGGSSRALYRLQRALGSTFWSWLREHDWGLAQNVFEDRWRGFVHEAIREGQKASMWPAELSLPEQDLVAMCGDEVQHVYRYDLHAERWSREVASGFAFGLHGILPGDDGYIVTGQLLPDGGEDRFKTLLVRNGDSVVTLAGDERPGPLLLPWNVAEPGGRRMVVWLFDNPSSVEWAPRVALLDPASCSTEGCSFEAVPGMPVWSPDGSRKAMVDVTEGSTVYYEYHGRELQKEMSPAALPFWLDNDTFGVIGVGTTGRRQAVQIRNISTGESFVLLTSQDAMNAIPEDRRPTAMYFRGLLRDPSDANSILAVMSPHEIGMINEESFLLEIRRSDQRSSWIGARPEVRLLHGFVGIVPDNWFTNGVSRNGQWLTLEVQRGSLRETQGSGLVIYDLQKRRLVLDSALPDGGDFPGQVGDWSADGLWLARSLSQRIELIAPGVTIDAQPFRYSIFHDFRDCSSVGWVNR